MKYCTNCGTPNPDDSRFCRECGFPMEGTGGQKSAPPKKKKQGNWRWLFQEGFYWLLW